MHRSRPPVALPLLVGLAALCLLPTSPWATPGAHQRSVRPGSTLRLQLKRRLVQPTRTKPDFKLTTHLDPTFGGHHPAFRRLHSSGWYEQTARIDKLQKKADALKGARKIPLSTPLSQVEMIAFDLEATGGHHGSYRGNRTFKSGWDEVTQFGYTIYRGGRVVKKGTIDIRPDVKISRGAQNVTGLTAERLRTAKRFEDVAGKILDLMKGRVLVGQSAIHNDYSWLQSAYARLGVDLPRPKRLIIDTHLLSRHFTRSGAGLAAMAQGLGVEQRNAHNAGDDARVTGEVALKLFERHGARTLGDAFHLQHQGYQIMKAEARAASERDRARNEARRQQRQQQGQ